MAQEAQLQSEGEASILRLAQRRCEDFASIRAGNVEDTGRSRRAKISRRSCAAARPCDDVARSALFAQPCAASSDLTITSPVIGGPARAGPTGTRCGCLVWRAKAAAAPATVSGEPLSTSSTGALRVLGRRRAAKTREPGDRPLTVPTQTAVGGTAGGTMFKAYPRSAVRAARRSSPLSPARRRSRPLDADQRPA